jgi:hypothetical protein
VELICNTKEKSKKKKEKYKKIIWSKMTFLAGDWVKVVQVIDMKESEQRSDYNQRQDDKRKLIGTIQKIKRIKLLSAAVYTGQNISLENVSHWLFHADELEKVDFPQPPADGDLIRFTANGDICQVVAVRAEYRLFYRVVDDSVDSKVWISDDLKTWSVSESFIGDRNVFQVLTQEEKVAHETATLVAKRNVLVAKASASMTYVAAAMQRAITDNEAINKEIVAINEQLEKLKPE